jgi:hypothetical protein
MWMDTILERLSKILRPKNLKFFEEARSWVYKSEAIYSCCVTGLVSTNSMDTQFKYLGLYNR